MPLRYFAFVLLLFFYTRGYSQPPIQFTIASHFFSGIKILKVKRDFNDSYLWVLAQNNQVYRINSVAQTVDDYTAVFAGYNNFQFIDIAGRSMDTVFIATSTSNVIQYKNGSIKLIGNSQGLTGTVTSVGIDFTENTANAFGMPPNNNLLLRIGTDNGLKDYNTDTEALTPDMYSPDSSKVFEATYRSIMFSEPRQRCFWAIRFSTITLNTIILLPGMYQM
jgi:hypothetical protein